VLADEKGTPATPHTASQIMIFYRQGGAWTLYGLREFTPIKSASPSEARAQAEALAALTGDCACVAGQAISGIPFSVLNRRGRHIFELPALSQEALTGIAEEIARADAALTLSAAALKSAAPMPTGPPGEFAVDLAALTAQYPELSSKMILKPFFRNTPFEKLVIFCRHEPPWLARETAYQITRQQQADRLSVTVINNLETR